MEPNDPKVRAPKTEEIVSKKVGISAKTYQRAKNIIEKETEELKKKVRSGKTSISYAAKSVKRAEDHKPENILKHY